MLTPPLVTPNGNPSCELLHGNSTYYPLMLTLTCYLHVNSYMLTDLRDVLHGVVQRRGAERPQG